MTVSMVGAEGDCGVSLLQSSHMPAARAPAPIRRISSTAAAGLGTCNAARIGTAVGGDEKTSRIDAQSSTGGWIEQKESRYSSDANALVSSPWYTSAGSFPTRSPAVRSAAALWPPDP